MTLSHKKGLSPIIATVILLVVITTSYISLSGWYKSFVSDYHSNTFYPVDVSEENLQILGIKNENSLYYLYLRYYEENGQNVIDKIKINGNTCEINNNILLEKKNSQSIQINCSGISSTNEVVIYTSGGTVQERVKLY